MAFIEVKKDEIILFPNADFKAKINEAATTIKEQYKLNTEISKLVYRWRSVMAHTKTQNELKQTFTLSHIQKHDYGYSARIIVPDGLDFDQLELLKPKIETGLQCIFLYEIPDHREFALVKIVKPKQVKCNQIPFTPVKVKPYEWYAGVDVSGQPIIFNVNITPHILYGGATRRGKNGSLDAGLTSLIYSCNERQIQLYLFQFAKNDMIKYRNCKQVMIYEEDNYDNILKAMQIVNTEMKRRKVLMEPMFSDFKGTNIYDFNKLGCWGHLPYIYIVCDEFMQLMDKTDGKDEKQQILSYLKNVAEYGAAFGVIGVYLTQKSDKENMIPFVKNMCTVRIAFGFEDDVGGEIILGKGYGKLTHNLPPRRAYFMGNGKLDILYTNDTTGRLKQFLQPSIMPNHKTILDITDSRNKKSNDTIPSPTQTSSGKIKVQNFSEVNKTQQEIMQENTSKIPGFVPYQPITEDTKVIDKTNIIPLNTQKPIKGGKIVR